MSDLTDAKIERMIEQAAERGAQKALSSLGLSDDKAEGDVRELRSLLSAWRTVRISMLKTAANMVTAFLLGALALGVGAKIWRDSGQ